MSPLRRFLAVVALLSAFMIGIVEPHMIMKSPVPYGEPDNSPLSSSGSNYPCKVTSDAATFYSTDGIIDQNSMVAGESQTLSFTGSAVHGGGSCQLAITNDMQPSASTSWRVILSIESGCPSTDSTNPATYNFTIPEETEAGQYSFAWTWISKLAGQPEYYMNCAPITVTASSSSKAKRDGVSLLPRADSYPELFVANLESINSCETTAGTDVVYPDPGDNVERLLTGATPTYATITASGCVPLSQTQGSSSLPTATAGGSDNSSASTTAAASTTASAGQTTSASSAAAASSETSQSTSYIFAPTGNQQSSGSPTTLATSATATSNSLQVIPVTTHDSTSSVSSSTQATGGSLRSSSGIRSVTRSLTTTSIAASTTTSSTASAPTSSVASADTSSAASSKTTSKATSTLSATGGSASATGSGSSNSTSSSGGASVKSGSCTEEGMFNCVGSDYQQCASGSWSTMQDLPAGTTCQQGESEGLWARGVGTNLLRKARRGAKFAYVR